LPETEGAANRPFRPPGYAGIQIGKAFLPTAEAWSFLPFLRVITLL